MITLRAGQKTAQKTTIGACLKRARLIEAGEKDFARLVAEVEADPVFRKLLDWGVIGRQFFPGVSPAFFRRVPVTGAEPAGPGSAPDRDETLPAAFLRLDKADIVRFFLAPDRLYKTGEISFLTGLPRREVVAAADWLSTRAGGSPTAPPPPARAGKPSRETRVIGAFVLRDGRPGIEDFTLDLARGRYRLDEERLRLAGDSLTPAEQKNARRVITRLNWINTRRSVIFRVVLALAERQAEYLASSNPDKLQPVSQVALSREIGLDPGVICRAVRNRALKAADGSIVALRDLLPGRRARISRLVREIARGENGVSPPDEEIRRRLASDWGVNLSRRAVNWHRHR